LADQLEQQYTGGWRVEAHPRLLADTTGDGRADIVGFGYDGVWLARAAPGGGFAPPQFVIPHYGYGAGWWLVDGWRVESHPRLVADVTGDGRADVVAFGDAGVYVSPL
jgi:VCBS repeat protein